MANEMLEFPKHFDGLRVPSTVLSKAETNSGHIVSIMRCRQLYGLDGNVFLKTGSPKITHG